MDSEAEPTIIAIYARFIKDPEKRTEDGYQDGFREAFDVLRLTVTYDWDIRAPQTEVEEPYALESDIPYRLREELLPQLKERLTLLSSMADPASTQNVSEAKYNEFFEFLFKLELYLEKFYGTTDKMWHDRSNKRIPKAAVMEPLSRFRRQHITDQVKHLFTITLDKLFSEPDRFLWSFCESNKAADDQAIFVKRAELENALITANEEIDDIIDWLRKPFLSVTIEDWQNSAKEIELMLLRLTSVTIVLVKQHGLSSRQLKCMRVGIPVIKLCRLLFKRFSRLNSQDFLLPNSFIDSNIESFHEFLEATNLVPLVIGRLVIASVSRSSPRGISKSVAFVNFLLQKCLLILRQHWDSLTGKVDDAIQIENASQWLDAWAVQLNYAMLNIENATGQEIDRTYVPGPPDDSEASDDLEIWDDSEISDDSDVSFEPDVSLRETKEEWQLLARQLEENLNTLLEISNREEEYVVSARQLECIRAGIPLFKLCRLLFAKLTRPANKRYTFFIDSSTDTTVNQFKGLITATRALPEAMERFVDSIHSPDSPRGISRPSAILNYWLKKFSPILWKHWDFLTENDFPAIDPVSIDNASEWLDMWNSQLQCAMENVEKATGGEIDWSYRPNDPEDSEVSRGSDELNEAEEEEESDEEENEIRMFR
ncbi:hypothetical protein PSTT_11817 [Puccinia striiformis]|uniref:Uncharacterized protein n=1 Tax=Puccinia striiformis TaxID=27350 RepID=A0A2S4UYM2_9BASI|nr:hypothetical protein PSTT_11817 [Puccinia striiformis]